MKNHLTTGIAGEQIAYNFFSEKGFNIIHTNWRYGHCEIDIIASRNKVLHFIEVKTRRNETFGLPEDSINKKKMNNLITAAEAFTYKHPEWRRIQFDVLSIVLEQASNPEFYLLEDVYF